jgi:triacylglycerol lipase
LSLASLPSSFTTLLLSLLDSPAYANLSTTYLREVFNPHTPDDPKVRYFSVAGRLSSMNIWHPLWLPKMVLDGYEERERERLGERWKYEDGGEKWGNDGLVSVQSAKWGEFLGILEEVDHWELRGARGFDLNVDLPWGSGRESEPSRGGEGWNLGDWSRFVRAWKKEERKARGAGAAVSDREESDRAKGTDKERAQALDSAAKEKEQGFMDDVVKASTEKVSAVFDWIVDQVPSRGSSDAAQPQSLSAALEAKQAAVAKREVQKSAVKSELAKKVDLERFYVALCRKLYNEGL